MGTKAEIRLKSGNFEKVSELEKVVSLEKEITDLNSFELDENGGPITFVGKTETVFLNKDDIESVKFTKE